VTTGAAEIETNKTSFSKSERLAFLASFNPDIITKVNEASAALSTVLHSSDWARGSQGD
jgi:hypothetical protein